MQLDYKLPKSWKSVELFSIAKILKGTSITKKDTVEGKIPVIAGGQSPAYFHNEANRYDCVITISASGAYAGFISYFEEPIYASDCTTVQSRDENLILTKFLYHLLKSKQKDFYQLQKGAGQPHVYAKDFKKMQIPLPPFPTQCKIVEILDAADELRKKRREADEKMKDLIPAIFVKMFGDPATNPMGWNLKELNEVAKFVRGPFGGALKKEIFVEKGYKVYEQRHAIHNNFEIGSYFINKEKFNGMQRFSVTVNDLIISCSGTTGKIALVPEDFEPGIINQALLKLTPDDKCILPLILKLFLESEYIQKKYFQSAMGVAIKNVMSVKELKKIEVPLPPMEKQVEILRVINGVESQAINQKKANDKLHSLFNSLMYKAFRGNLCT